MTKAKDTTPKPDDEAEAARQAAIDRLMSSPERLAAEAAAKAEAATQADPAAIAEINDANAVQSDTGTPPDAEPEAQAGCASADHLQALIEEIEAHMHYELMPLTIAALTEREGLRVLEDPGSPQITVALAGVECTAATTSPMIAMGVWCNAARRVIAESAAA